MKCRNGLRVLGADVSGVSSWQITVDVSQKRRSATVTASTAAVDPDKRAYRLWLLCPTTSYSFCDIFEGLSISCGFGRKTCCLNFSVFCMISVSLDVSFPVVVKTFRLTVSVL